MPPKRNKTKQMQKKQLKIIQARLMEISLKMDNYIYKNRPISMNDAQIYYQEVSSYKNRCIDNARILQVIDKLKHQLKALIEDVQHSTDTYNVQEIIENSITTCPISLTYSIHSEGRVAPSNDRWEVENDNSVAIDIDGQANYIESIDLCDNEDVIKMTRTEKQDSSSNIKEIERSLSHLTVNTKMVIQTDNVPGSAIDNIKTNSMKQQCPRSNDNYKTVTDIGRADFVSSYNKNLSQDIIQVSGNNLTKSKNNVTRQINKSIPSTNKLEDKIPAKTEAKKKRRTNKTKQDVSDKSVQEMPKKRRYKKHCDTQDTTITIDQTTNNNFVKSVRPPLTKKNIMKPAKVVLHAKSHPMNAVYNENVENDLSWVENVRYIREVSPDEIDSKLTYLDDRFWQTLDLPANWNDQDFLY